MKIANASASVSLMLTKVVAVALTVLINITLGVVIFFFMLIAMNGYSESDAGKGLIAYVLLAVVATALMGTATFLTSGILIRRGLSGISSALIVVPAFSLIGGGLKIVCSMIGIAIAEYVRVNY